jgi:hypothetical protein
MKKTMRSLPFNCFFFFSLFLRAGCKTCLTSLTRWLTNLAKPKLETSLVPARIFPKLTEEGSPLLFRAQWGREILILNYLGKGRKRLRIGGKESSRLNA